MKKELAHRIKQYGLLRLLNIIFFRSVYYVLRRIDSIFLPCNACKYAPPNNHEGDIVDVSYYNDLCINNAKIIDIAEEIFAGQVTIFGYKYAFDYLHDWLKDPITGNEWPQDSIWYKSSIYNSKCSDVKYILELNKLNHLVSLAHAYHISKDEKYVNHIYREIIAWQNNVPFGYSVVNKITMDWAFRSINLMHISFLCNDSITYKDKLHPIICSIIKSNANFIYKFCTSRWFKTGNDNNHNHNIGELIGLYTSCLWIGHYTQRQISDSKKLQILRYLKCVLDKTIDITGVYLEQSASYSRLVSEFLIWFDLIDNTFNKDHKFTEWFYKGRYVDRLIAYIKALEYNNQLPNFGDNDAAQILMPFSNDFCDIRHIVSYSEYHNNNIGVANDYQWVYKSVDSNELFVFVRYGLFAMYREGAFVHSHCDLLSPIISAHEEEIIIDKGCSYYNQGVEIRENYTQNKAHNTISIDNIDMATIMRSGYKLYPKCRIIDRKTSDTTFEIAMELNYKNILHYRCLLYNNNTLMIKDVIRIFDTAASLHKGEIHYLLAEYLQPHKCSNMVELESEKTGRKYSINIEGLDVLEINSAEYYPHYAARKTTNEIVGKFTIDSQLEITTTIIL